MPFSLEDNPEVLHWPKRLRAPFAWVEHIPFAFHLLKIFKPRRYVELGVHIGNSFSAVCQGVKSLGLETECFGVDTWTGDVHAGFYAQNIYEELSEYVSRVYPSSAKLLRMTFNEALPKFADGSIDLLHIDGLHTYDAVKADYESWLPKMSERGLIMFHDSAVRTGDFGVFRLWEEISVLYPSFEFQHGFGLGLLAVGKNVPEAVLEFIESTRADISSQILFARLGLAVQARAEKAAVQEETVRLRHSLAEAREVTDSYVRKLDDAGLAEQYFAEMSFDLGDGGAGKTERIPVDGRETSLEFSFPVDLPAVTLLSFRPFFGPLALRLHSIELIDKDGKAHRLEEISSNHFHSEDGVYLFKTDKPKFIVSLQQIDEPRSIRVELSYVAIGSRFFAFFDQLLTRALEKEGLGFAIGEGSLRIQASDKPTTLPPREQKTYDPEMLQATLFLHEELRKKDALINEQQKHFLLLEDRNRILENNFNGLQEAEKRYLELIDARDENFRALERAYAAQKLTIEDRDEHYRTLERAFEVQRQVIEDRDKHFRVLESHLKAASESFEHQRAQQELELQEARRLRNLSEEIISEYEGKELSLFGPERVAKRRIIERWKQLAGKGQGN